MYQAIQKKNKKQQLNLCVRPIY